MSTRPMTDYEKITLTRWKSCKINPDKMEPDIAAQKIIFSKDRYESIGINLWMPFWVIGLIHYRESSFDFNTHLYNGDPLSDRTVNVPSGQPVQGNPPFTWEQSALGALDYEGFGHLQWDVVNTLVRLEKYNGFGYRKHNRISPYIWSMTDLYKSGKYASDGHYDSSLIDGQAGCAAIMISLKARGLDLKEDIEPDN